MRTFIDILQEKDIIWTDLFGRLQGSWRGTPKTRAETDMIVLHCSATKDGHPYTPQQLQKDHKQMGYHGAGYHFYVRRDGHITQHRALNEVGAHARGYNNSSIGLCYEGGLDAVGHPKDTLTDKQYEALVWLIDIIQERWPEAELLGHNDLPGVEKACPCFNVSEKFKEICR